MAHPVVLNSTPFVVEPLFVADEDGYPVVAPIVRATFTVGHDGSVMLTEEQAPVNFEGEYVGEPGESSLRYEPETAFVKSSTDVVLIGHAVAPRPGTTVLDVHFRVGPVAKAVRVFGDRHLLSNGEVSEPQPFDRIPLTYERAFGGWDRTPEDPEDHSCEPSNPVGVGFSSPKGKLYEGDPVPNIEDPNDPYRTPRTPCKAAGFGFLAPNWEPRLSYAGTYDQTWTDQRAPRLPTDFDRRFFNAASDGLVTPQYLTGREPVVVDNATRRGRWAFHLPGIPNPRCVIARTDGEVVERLAPLDTVIVDADEGLLTLLWRCSVRLNDGPLDVRELSVDCALPAGLHAVPTAS